MNYTQSFVYLILGVVDGIRRLIEDRAIKIANKVDGLKVTQSGEIAITGNPMTILTELLKSYEEELGGEIVVDIDVRLNLVTFKGPIQDKLQH